jgi:ubiquinone biosynthesis protein
MHRPTLNAGKGFLGVSKKIVHLGSLVMSAPLYPYIPNKSQYATWARQRLESCGCLYIKMGQWVSSRTDIFPMEIASELQVLQSGSDPMSPHDVQRVIQQSGLVFDAFDTVPVSTGSIAHVHKAVYKGQTVAVKVQRPGILESLQHDLALMTRALHHLRFLISNTKMIDDTVSSLTDLIDAVRRETDFLEEASHMIRFRTFFNNQDIIVPDVIQATPHVIVMEYIESTPYTGSSSMLIDIFFRQFFDIGWLHTDMHAGNVGQTKDGIPVLFDFGSVMEIPESIVLGIKALMVSYLNKNTKVMLQYMIEYEILVGTPTPEDTDMLVSFIDNVIQYVEITDIDQFTEMMKTIPVTSTPETTFRDDVFMIMRSFTLLEGLCKQLDSNFVIIDAVMPLMERFASDPMMARLKVEDDIRHIFQLFQENETKKNL